MSFSFYSPTPLSAEQVNPFQAALQTAMQNIGNGENLYKNLLSLKKSQAELPYAAPLAKSTADYKIAMANYLMSPNQALRHLSGLGRTYIEPSVVSQILGQYGANPNKPVQGFSYDSSSLNNQENPINESSTWNNPLSNSIQNVGNKEDISDRYALQRQKMSSDPDARKKNLFASNIEKTMEYIDPKAMTQYSGPINHLRLAKDALFDSMGKKVPEYENYVKSMTASNLMATQVRQFYGDSITVEMENRLKKLTNPSNWLYNPEVAEKLFNQTKDILSNELETYRQALKSTSPYQSQKSKINQINKNIDNSEGDEGIINLKLGQKSISMVTPDGKRWNVPIERMQEAIKRGARQIE